MERINSLEELVEFLEDGRFDEVLDQIHDIDITVSDCEDYIFWNEDYYTRNCIARNKEFELLLLCWEPGQGSAIHNHNKQECFVKVISGEFEESVFTYNTETKNMDVVEVKELKQTEISALEDLSLFHQLTNKGDEPAISLHLYMKPILECKVYNQNAKCFTTLASTDYSRFGEVL